jgi:hypothetical protein
MDVMHLSEPMFHFTHGDHTCVFYWDLQGLLEVLTPYIAEGLRQNERCFCAQRPETLKALCNDLRFIGVDIEREQKRGALELHTTNEVYFRNMRFDPDALMELLERSVEDSVRNGFSAFRTAGELSWAVEGRNECDKLVAYEKLVEASYPSKPAVGICLYPIRSFEPAVLDRVVAAHSKVLHYGCHSSSTASLHVHWPECEAEIVTKRYTADAPYHYVVQRQSGEVLAWGESADFKGAVRAAGDASGSPHVIRPRE